LGFPDLLLLVLARRRDCAELLLIRHITHGHLLEHTGQDIGEEPELADLADRQRQRDRDRFLGPVECNKTFDTAPLVDGIERLAGDVFNHRAHGAVVVGGFRYQYLDFVETGGNRLPDAAVTGLDRVTVISIHSRRDHRRLDDADRLHGCQQQRIGLWA
jgi:hypothetical protein